MSRGKNREFKLSFDFEIKYATMIVAEMLNHFIWYKFRVLPTTPSFALWWFDE
jgi:hypothetical protein